MKICAYNLPELKKHSIYILTLENYILFFKDQYEEDLMARVGFLKNLMYKFIMELKVTQSNWIPGSLKLSDIYIIPMADFIKSESYISMLFIDPVTNKNTLVSERSIPELNKYWISQQKQFDQNKLLEWFHEAIDFVDKLSNTDGYNLFYPIRNTNNNEATPDELNEYERVKYSLK